MSFRFARITDVLFFSCLAGFGSSASCFADKGGADAGVAVSSAGVISANAILFVAFAGAALSAMSEITLINSRLVATLAYVFLYVNVGRNTALQVFVRRSVSGFGYQRRRHLHTKGLRFFDF